MRKNQKREESNSFCKINYRDKTKFTGNIIAQKWPFFYVLVWISDITTLITLITIEQSVTTSYVAVYPWRPISAYGDRKRPIPLTFRVRPSTKPSARHLVSPSLVCTFHKLIIHWFIYGLGCFTIKLPVWYIYLSYGLGCFTIKLPVRYISISH